MTVNTIHKLDKIILPGSVEFSNLTNARWAAGIQSLLLRPAGHVHPMFRGTASQKPAVEFTTTDLDILLAAVPVGGAALGSTATFFKLGNTLSNAARNAASHQKITIASSLGYWSTIRLPHNQAGDASVMLQAIYDGANLPFVYAGSQTLSGNLAAGNKFGCGPVSINGTTINGVQEITVDSGIRLLQLGSSTEEFDTFVGIQETEPSVTIRTLSMVNWATLGLRGLALNGSTGLVFYARKFTPSVTGGLARVANATAEHIAFVGLNGTANPVDTNGNTTDALTDTLRVELISASDSVLPLVITTAQQIS